MSIIFERSFSMAAFEGLRLLRVEQLLNDTQSIEQIVQIIQRTHPNPMSLDLDAALHLHILVDISSSPHDNKFYRHCISAILLKDMPIWAKLITLGRNRFISKLSGDTFRDIRSLFRLAGLLEIPPSNSDVEWWDFVSGRVRFEGDQQKLIRARQAEMLSIVFETERLSKLGIEKLPKWIAIEDNTAGYDVLSYNKTEYGIENKLIEVKSTIASPLRFYVTRNEWDHAFEIGDKYNFHIWDLQTNPPNLFQRTTKQILPHIPEDNEKGKWKLAEIPVNC